MCGRLHKIGRRLSPDYIYSLVPSNISLPVGKGTTEPRPQDFLRFSFPDSSRSQGAGDEVDYRYKLKSPNSNSWVNQGAFNPFVEFLVHFVHEAKWNLNRAPRKFVSNIFTKYCEEAVESKRVFPQIHVTNDSPMLRHGPEFSQWLSYHAHCVDVFVGDKATPAVHMSKMSVFLKITLQVRSISVISSLTLHSLFPSV